MRPVVLALSLFFFSAALSQSTDIEVLRRINTQRNTALDPTFRFLSKSASPMSMACPSVVFASGFLLKDTLTMRKGLYIASSMAVSAGITYAMKYGIQRDRPFVTYPDLEPLSEAGSPSFPSGHTSNAFATATALTLAYPKWYVALPAFAWAGAIGYSRMHLGVQYPSDVLVGAAVGAGSA